MLMPELAEAAARSEKTFGSGPTGAQDTLRTSPPMAAGDASSPAGGDIAASRSEASSMKHKHRQSPLLVFHAGANADAVKTWEAHAEADVGVLIRRYLADHPCPGASRIRGDLEDWADRLEAVGQARLAELGLRRLRPARTG